ncbi:MAG: phosphatase PAP2 family protein [Patescibacteria group bacterium]
MLSIDYSLFQLMNGWAVASQPLGMVAIFLARWLIYILIIGVASIGLWSVIVSRRTAGANRAALNLAIFIRAAFAVSGAVIDSSLISLVMFRSRPFVTQVEATLLIDPPLTIKSFPSDHTTIAFAIAVSVWLLDRRLGWLMLIGAIGIAGGRVMAGVHYPLDVLAGAMLGTAWALVVMLVARHWQDIKWLQVQIDKIHGRRNKI